MRTSKGFTLVELLVVIGIIAMLISILLPALGRARASAQSIACAAQLKEMGNAMTMYVNNNRGWLPRAANNVAPAPDGEGYYQGSWMFKIQPYLRRREVGSNAYNNETLFTHVFKCPSIDNFEVQSASNLDKISYAMNAFNRPNPTIEAVSKKVTTLKKSTEITLVSDIGEGTYRLLNSDFLYVNNVQRALRHNKRHNTLFVDGHVEALAKGTVTWDLLSRR
jgi:prepilin-type N-terminal cleavage/methylation domain-containing protein/prepilin-type processing-associated H-X9-DG protein